MVPLEEQGNFQIPLKESKLMGLHKNNLKNQENFTGEAEGSLVKIHGEQLPEFFESVNCARSGFLVKNNDGDTSESGDE